MTRFAEHYDHADIFFRVDPNAFSKADDPGPEALEDPAFRRVIKDPKPGTIVPSEAYPGRVARVLRPTGGGRRVVADRSIDRTGRIRKPIIKPQ